METVISYLFRFVAYVMFGLVMETLFAIDGIDRVLGYSVERRVPRKYLEGFVSVYMIPLHGLGVLFLFEPASLYIADLHLGVRFLLYAFGISVAESLWGFFLDKTFGFYTWDYYAKSRFKVFKRGYTLYTLIPFWGFAGLILEIYTGLMLHLSPVVVAYFKALW